MRFDFSSDESAIRSLIELDLSHSLDSADIHFIENIEIKEDCTLASLYKETYKFYRLLPTIRYATEVEDEEGYQGGQEAYLSWINNGYKDTIKKADEQVLCIFREIFAGAEIGITSFMDSKNASSDLLETVFIRAYYEVIVSTLNSLRYAQPGKASEDSKAYERFVTKRLRFSEMKNSSGGDNKAFSRWINNKVKRNSGPMRLEYWDRRLSAIAAELKDDQSNLLGLLPALKAACISKMSLLIGDNGGDRLGDKQYAIRNLIFVLLYKYHVVIHEYAHGAFSFRSLDQHLQNDAKKRFNVERAQAVFTFTHIMARYLPDLFMPNETNKDKSRCIALVLEIMSFKRRGICYEAFNQPVEAFNDYKLAARLTRRLREVLRRSFGGNVAQCKKGRDALPIELIYRKQKDPFIKLAAKCSIVISPYISALIGHVYRRDHAFFNAHNYYCTAIESFERGSEDGISELYADSFAVVRIKIAKGKTFLELGKFKKSLKWYLKALENIISILSGKKPKTFRLDDAKEHRRSLDGSFCRIFGYLEDIRHDPSINKSELYDVVLPLCEGLLGWVEEPSEEPSNKLSNEARLKRFYGILLSDLFSRIGFVLMLLNIPDVGREAESDVMHEHEPKWKDAMDVPDREKVRRGIPRNGLALRFLSLSHRLNPSNPMSYFNLLLLSFDPAPGNVTNELLKNYSKDTIANFIDLGLPRDIVYRLISRWVLQHLHRPNCIDNIHARLMRKFLIYTEDFATKNAELYKYLMKDYHRYTPQFSRDKTNDSVIKDPYGNGIKIRNEFTDTLHFHVLQRWSSVYPALPRPSTFKMKGGGYFLTYKGHGIAIDPGIDFVENLYSEGFSIADINFIVVTHDHVDHTADIDKIWSLHYKRFGKFGKDHRLTFILNPTVSSRYNAMLHQDEKMYRKIELQEESGIITIVPGLTLKAVNVRHHDLTSPNHSHAIGLIFGFEHGGQKFGLGITSDTVYDKEMIAKFEGVDILIVHINSATFKELYNKCGIKPEKEDSLLRNLIKLEEVEDTPSASERNPSIGELSRQIKYSLGYDPAEYRYEDIFITGKPKPEPSNTSAPAHGNEEPRREGHMLLEGVIDTFNDFLLWKSDRERLFIIAEFSEEMGSYRQKVATFLQGCAEKCNPMVTCLSADIGMVVRRKMSDSEGGIEVKCVRCAQRNDYTEDDKFHPAGNIKEVCLKHEDEGIFYLCRRHDPEGVDRDGICDLGFIESIERYQPFKHLQ